MPVHGDGAGFLCYPHHNYLPVVSCVICGSLKGPRCNYNDCFLKDHKGMV